jgi:dTDP-4-amino-4,6-dideoxygalactose transaminase
MTTETMSETTEEAVPATINEKFEQLLIEFTGAKGVVLVDNIAHAIELGLRYDRPKMYATIPSQAPVDVAMTMSMLDIEYMLDDEDKWDEYYRINGSIVYDCRDHFAKDMFQTDNPNQRRLMCISFGEDAPLEIGHGAAILTNDRAAYDWLVKAANGGRNPKVIEEKQKEYDIGYQYQMRSSDAHSGIQLLNNLAINDTDKGYKAYRSLRDITINK